jgi:UDP-N-acetyl-D-mannosaminuronic acid dehydrogenase
VGELLICEPNLKTHRDFDLLPLDEALRRADIVVLLVDHDVFRKVTPAQLAGKVLIDTRGVIR